MNGRRGFFKNVGLGILGVAVGANAEKYTQTPIIHNDKPIKITKVEAHINPRFMNTVDIDDIFKDAVLVKTKDGLTYESKYILINIHHGSTVFKSITLKTPINTQFLYSALHEEWRIQSELIKYPFPMTAITPEQFQIVDGWGINTDNLRIGGIAFMDENNSCKNEYAAVLVLSQEGLVFNENNVAMENGALTQVKDGVIQGSYQRTPTDKVTKLSMHFKEHIDIDTATYIGYRIA